MKKRILAALLAGVMTVGLTACGGGDDAAAGGDAGTAGEEDAGGTAAGTESGESGAAADTGDDGSTAAAYDFSDKEHVTLKLYMFGDADTAECEAVSAALSEITNEKLNCDVELTRIGFGSYQQQVNLVLSSGEQIDVFAPFGMSLGTLANSGQIYPMTELLPEYAAETFAAIPEIDWSCGMIGDDYYMMPANKDKAMDLGFMMRKDILDELGMTVDDIKSFDDLHDLLVKVKEAHPDMYPVVPDFAAMMGYMEVDNLGDNLGVIMTAFENDSLTVENLYASDYYMELCTMMYNWAQEGLIMPDASSNTESGNNLIKSGRAFGRFSHMKIGFESENTNSIGTEIVCWRYTEPISVTSKLTPGWVIGENSVDHARAVALLNLMYTDPEVSNLVINGIEGVHYEFADEAKGVIRYPDGKDATSAGYARQAWGWPNEQISYLWEGDPETLWEDLNAFNENARQSPAKGFTFDNSMVLNEVTACNNVVTKYHNALIGGQLDPSTTIPEFVAELEKAGIDKIIAEKPGVYQSIVGFVLVLLANIITSKISKEDALF